MKDVELLENVVFTKLYQEQVKETQETIVRLGELDVNTRGPECSGVTCLEQPQALTVTRSNLISV